MASHSPDALEWARARNAELVAFKAGQEQRVADQQIAWKTARDAASDAEQQTNVHADDLRAQIADLNAQLDQLSKDLAASTKPLRKAMAAAVVIMVDKEKQPLAEVAVRLGIDVAEVRKARSEHRPRRAVKTKTSPTAGGDSGLNGGSDGTTLKMSPTPAEGTEQKQEVA